MISRYSIACRSCDGRGFLKSTDSETGIIVVDDCSCYRGRITILLNAADEDKLLAELQKVKAQR